MEGHQQRVALRWPQAAQGFEQLALPWCQALLLRVIECFQHTRLHQEFERIQRPRVRLGYTVEDLADGPGRDVQLPRRLRLRPTRGLDQTNKF